jgi:hypothetical protein
MPNPTLRLSRWSGAGRADFVLELDLPNVSAVAAHNGGILRLPFTSKPDEVPFGTSLLAVHGRLVIAESVTNSNPGIKIPMQTWYPNHTTVEVPLTFTDMALAEIGRKSEDAHCWLELAALANVRHQAPTQPQQTPPWPTQAWMTTVVRDDNAAGMTFVLKKQDWLELLKSMSFERTRLVELPVAAGAGGPEWAECLRLIQNATSDLNSNRRDGAVSTCRKVVEGISRVLATQWGVVIPNDDSMTDRLKELAGRMASAWPNDKEAGPMLATLYGAAWSWSSPEHHYGSLVPEQAEAEFAVLLTASLLTHAGYLLRVHPQLVKKPVPSNGQP